MCTVYVQESVEAKKRVLVSSFYHVITGNHSQVVRLGTSDLLSHLRAPHNCFTVHSSPCVFSFSPWLILPIVVVVV